VKSQRWDVTFSVSVRLVCGVRKGAVLSSYLFVVFFDSVVEKSQSQR